MVIKLFIKSDKNMNSNETLALKSEIIDFEEDGTYQLYNSVGRSFLNRSPHKNNLFL